MSFIYYIATYLGIGATIMIILDTLHRLVKDQIVDEFKEGYTNWERIYVILTWPVFTYSLIKSIIKNK